jgi:hypothetical protein
MDDAGMPLKAISKLSTKASSDPVFHRLPMPTGARSILARPARIPKEHVTSAFKRTDLPIKLGDRPEIGET